MDDPALAEHQHAVGEAQHLGYLAGDQQDGEPFVGEAAHHPRTVRRVRRRRRTRGLVQQQHPAAVRNSQRARTAFCWLPPDRVRTGTSGLSGRRDSSRTAARAAARSCRRRSTQSAREKRDREDTETFR
ncbi:hypothetical protein GCM10017687_87730 [Streptomyces echinatus]